MSAIESFRSGLRARHPMIGTFLKTPSAIVGEVLSLTPLDCVCIDAEHAPFGPLELDVCLAALRAGGMPSLVRVRNGTAGEILGALDSGATGVVIPHVADRHTAVEAVRVSHYSSNGRGYAGSSRAARYTTKPMADHLRDSAAITTVVAQIEDAAALDHLDDIAAVEGIDCLFIGRMDLTVSMGAVSPLAPDVVAAVERICAVGQRHGKCVGMFVPPGEDVVQWQRHGASLFLQGSDQQFMLIAAGQLAAQLTR